MSASSQCPHSDLDFNIHTTLMQDSNVHSVQIGAKCKLCGKKMKLSRGLPMGASSQHPTIAPDTEFLDILIPMLAEDEQPTKEWGFTVTRTIVA